MMDRQAVNTDNIPLVVRRTIAASRTTLFDAFSRAELLSQWFTPSADITLDVLSFAFEVGGTYRFRYSMPDGRKPVVGGHYEKINRPELIVVSWIWEPPDPLANVPMRVSFAFRDLAGGTEVAITHEKLPSDAACTIHEDGWERSLDSLERCLPALETHLARLR